MMEWTLAILFGAAVVLFIMSFYKAKQTSNDVQQQLDHMTFTYNDQINKLQEQVRNLEIDAEISAQVAGNPEEQSALREMIDMQRRGYSLESIATKFEKTEAEIESSLTPYVKPKSERGTVENDS
ncbi:hypothetical protein [Bacillus sp. T3]|uniref:hypothetical protein n=1 Tax=Bacillus sp. T3 TaxID=467262 RepID=UPI002981BE6E|nr:hypothetical protein [Bacillus sp. T3]